MTVEEHSKLIEAVNALHERLDRWESETIKNIHRFSCTLSAFGIILQLTEDQILDLYNLSNKLYDERMLELDNKWPKQADG